MRDLFDDPGDLGFFDIEEPEVEENDEPHDLTQILGWDSDLCPDDEWFDLDLINQLP